jgi:hypothetical protein
MAEIEVNNIEEAKEKMKEIDPTGKGKPTPEEVTQFKADFQNSIKTFDETRWIISEPGSFGANDVGLYLIDYINKFALWKNTEWMGLIKMEEEVKKSMSFADASTGLAFSYQALEFCAYMLTNPGGTGLKLAKEFEAQADKYSKIGIVVGTRIEQARKQLKEIQVLQDKYLASEQGFYYEPEPEIEAAMTDPSIGEAIKETQS